MGRLRKPMLNSRQPVVVHDSNDNVVELEQVVEDIRLMKDGQGRLYGNDGAGWKPVKVDSEGRLIISSDVTVNAEGMVVDLGQIKQGPAGTEPWPVQLSGNIVAENGRTTLTIDEESIFEFAIPHKELIITNLGPGVLHISFDDTPATDISYRLDPMQSISGISCSKMRLFSPSATPEVQWLGVV